MANIPFEDKHISFEEWPQLKAGSPFGQLPVLEVRNVLRNSQACRKPVHVQALKAIVPNRNPQACRKSSADHM